MELITLPGVYNNEEISSIAVNENYIFLGTKSGLIRLDKMTGIPKNIIMILSKELMIWSLATIYCTLVLMRDL